MTAIVDYGVGNLFSLSRSLDHLGVENEVTGDPERLRQADRIILPGVGAFGDAREKLAAGGLDQLLIREAEKGKPLLGICLGMQLLFERGFEFGERPGLGLVPGSVCPLAPELPPPLKAPHIGWNSLIFTKPSPLFRYSREGDFVYYVHSFYAKDCGENTVAASEYGVMVTGAVQRGNVFGTQFHPEKSGSAGLAILKAFTEIQ